MPKRKRDEDDQLLYIRYSVEQYVPANYDDDTEYEDDSSAAELISTGRLPLPRTRIYPWLSRKDLIFNVPDDQENSASRSHHNGTSSALLRLPKEVRRMIWAQCVKEAGHHVNACFPDGDLICKCPTRGIVTILYVCRQIRNEALSEELDMALMREGHFGTKINCSTASFFRICSEATGNSAVVFAGFNDSGDIIGFIMTPRTRKGKQVITLYKAFDKHGKVGGGNGINGMTYEEMVEENVDDIMESFALGRGRPGITTSVLEIILDHVCRTKEMGGF